MSRRKPPRFIGTKEVARRLGVVQRDVQALAQRGSLPFAYKGDGRGPAGQYLFLESDVDALIEARAKEAT